MVFSGKKMNPKKMIKKILDFVRRYPKGIEGQPLPRPSRGMGRMPPFYFPKQVTDDWEALLKEEREKYYKNPNKCELCEGQIIRDEAERSELEMEYANRCLPEDEYCLKLIDGEC